MRQRHKCKTEMWMLAARSDAPSLALFPANLTKWLILNVSLSQFSGRYACKCLLPTSWRIYNRCCARPNCLVPLFFLDLCITSKYNLNATNFSTDVFRLDESPQKVGELQSSWYPQTKAGSISNKVQVVTWMLKCLNAKQSSSKAQKTPPIRKMFVLHVAFAN